MNHIEEEDYLKFDSLKRICSSFFVYHHQEMINHFNLFKFQFYIFKNKMNYGCMANHNFEDIGMLWFNYKIIDDKYELIEFYKFEDFINILKDDEKENISELFFNINILSKKSSI